MKFLLASLKTITYSENCSESWIKFLFWLFIALLCRFSPVYIHGRLSGQFSGSQAAFGSTGDYQKTETSSLQRFIAIMIFAISY